MQIMANGIESLLLNKKMNNLFTSKNYQTVNDAESSLLFSVDRLSFLNHDYQEKAGNRHYFGSKVHESTNGDSYTFVNWKMVQTYNLLLGSKLSFTYIIDKQTKTFSKFFPSNLEKDQFLEQVTDMLATVTKIPKFTFSAIVTVDLEALFYNVNLETALVFTFKFNNEKKSKSS